MTVNRAFIMLLIFTLTVLAIVSGLWLYHRTNVIKCAYDDKTFQAEVKKQVMEEMKKRVLVVPLGEITATAPATQLHENGEIILSVSPSKKPTPSPTPTPRPFPTFTPTP